jgi:predicted transposase YbfD/YdcC
MNNFSKQNQKTAIFLEYFAPLKDCRRTNKGNIRHSLPEILFMSIAAIVSGCNTWESVETFSKCKIDWLREFFPYKYGIPSHDTLGKVFSLLDPKVFGKCFMEFTHWMAKHDSRVIAIDGKTVRGVASDGFPLHIVSAFCEKNKLCLSQQKVDEKSNEIIAIPLLLDLLTLDNCIITADAMACQKNIAARIISKKADYILQVKDNQKELHEQIQKLFKIGSIKDVSVQNDMGHGRIEKRTCRQIEDLQFLDGHQEWDGLRTVIEVEAEREDKKIGKKSTSKRYYISSLKGSAKDASSAIRGHWSIENNLHWNLDVIFEEDFQLKRKGNSAENFNLMIKVGLGLLEAESTFKKSKNQKRLKASLDDNYREILLNL